ncbi:MAG: penicillin-binding protein [Gammaproteobacteria bacterium]|nr:penicillin-binding protein [Gammaproteobacteria bacterium]
MVNNPFNFSAMHTAMQDFVDRGLLAGAISVILKDNRIIDKKAWGFADTASKTEIHDNTIFRIFSNTKIITSVAAMTLYEDGKFSLDDPVEKYLPQFKNIRVLKKGATDPAETEGLQTLPTIRQLMSHQAGISYGIFSESPVDTLYNECEILDPHSTLSEMVDKLARLPLAFQPGTRFQYSISTDVLARLVEIWSGGPFDKYLSENIFVPLGMADTGFHVPEIEHGRLATNYVPKNPLDPMSPGLAVAPEDILGGFLKPKALCSGGAGLVSTIADYTRFIQMLVSEGNLGNVQLLKPETVALMHTNQLPEGIEVQCPADWFMPNTVFGLGLAIKRAPLEGEPVEAIDEFHWGGLAGTHTWISPRAGIAALIFTQRFPGFHHEFSHEFKRQVYKAVG